MSAPAVDRHTTPPAVLAGQTIATVETTTHEYPEGYADIVLTLADGRRFELSSCSCCGGAVFNELVEPS